MKRRSFLMSAGAAPLVATLPTGAAQADGHAAPSVPIVQTHMVGDIKVTAVSDGFLQIVPGVLVGIDEAGFNAALERAHIAPGQHPTGVNAYLIETGEKKILVDAGTGPVFGPGLGHLEENLAGLGVTAGDIDTIVATHLHPDHIGGALINGVNPFEKAGLIAHSADIDFWTNDDIKAQAPDDFKPFFDLASGVVTSFGERIETVSGESDLGDGLTAIPMPGHTPGHIGVMVESNGDQLLIWGDIIHVGPVQFADPSVTIAFDADGDTAAATRARVMDMAATDNMKVAGAHLDFPGMGYLSKADSGYRWQPAPYPYG